MFRWIVYFPGPRTVWSGKVHEREIIARGSARWRWLALAWVQSVYGQLDPAVVGYAVVDEHGETVEHKPPPEPQMVAPA